MGVQVRLFAGLRERAGWSRRELEAATVADVWPQLGLGDEPPGLLYAVNQEYADRDTRARRRRRGRADPARLGRRVPALRGAARPERRRRRGASDEAGAVATFIGTTRIHSRGRTVHYLDYEAYGGMAEKVMAELAESLKAKHDLCAVAIHHRVGRVDIGGISVVIAVSAPHRAAALAACAEAIDTLKETVPLWKKEVYEGGEEWIGRGS